MSTLNVSNISDGSTSVGTSYVVNGSAKAWVNLNGQGTIALRDSFNVSSVTDAGTGNYTVNFSNSMENSSFAATASTWQSTSISGVGQNVKSPTTGSQAIDCTENNVVVDPQAMLMSIDGDLA